VSTHLRIAAIASARPPYTFSQRDLLRLAQEQLLGPHWHGDATKAEPARQIERLFRASGVECRQSAVDLSTYYDRVRSTGERMRDFVPAAHALGRDAMALCLAGAQGMDAGAITDFVVATCTGYSAPGLDVQIARDLGMAPDVRRTAVGHMGCFGALVGLRQCLAAVRAYPNALAALLTVELTTLHFTPTQDSEVLTSFALFGDAAAGLVLTGGPAAAGPEVVDTYCAADFGAASQMSWDITDAGFVMGLSPRVPVTLRRNVAGVVERLLGRNGLAVGDVTHWIAHPGGPSILDAIQRRLELSDAQMAPSWEVLREHGNCSSAAVLLILERLLRSGQARPGEWCVMMAFGPGLTLETCLLRM
jgi:predicted naringenin-chalcone synthase